MLYRLNLIPNYYQGLASFLGKNKSLDLIDIKKMQKQNNEVFFIQLVNAGLNFANFPTPTSMEKNSLPTNIFKPTHQTRLKI